MMNDRELLELAGKAHGFIDDQLTDDDGEQIGLHRNGQGIYYVVHKFGWHDWSPLVDDSEALRLAVKLGICIDTSDGVHVQYIVDGCSHPITEYEFYDIYASTRRAIVRAAAEIGKAMP